MEKIDSIDIENFKQIVQFVKKNSTDVMEFLHKCDTDQVIYSITKYSEGHTNGKDSCCIPVTEYYILTDRNITVLNALKLLGFSTNIDVTYSEDVDVQVEPVNIKQYLNNDIRLGTPLSQFTIIETST